MDLKRYRWPLIIALLQWILTTILHIDKYFFSYEGVTVFLIGVKIIYLVFLSVSWCFIANVINKLKENDQRYKRGVIIFLFYLAIMMALMLFLWPGTWYWDDLGGLISISGYNSLYTWHHILSGLYQDVLLQILPFPGGIILLQNIIISICVAAIVTGLEEVFEIGRISLFLLDIFVKIIPFLLPPVLMYQFSGYRMGLYIYLELLIIVKLLEYYNSQMKLSWENILLICFLVVVVSTWRTESFLYIPIVCILILKKKNQLSIVKKGIVVFLILLGFCTVNKCQNILLGNENYKMISLLGPGAELVRAADPTEDATELESMDKVTDLSIIYDNPTLGGEALYWGVCCVREGYTEDDYNNYLKALIKLSLKYPKAVINERLSIFKISSGVTGYTVNNIDTAIIFDENGINAKQSCVMSMGLIGYKPIFHDARRAFIYLLGGKNPKGEPIKWSQLLIWNASIPILALVFAWIRSIVKRKWFYWSLISLILTKLIIVILTEPAGWFMYLLSFYLIGYVYLVYAVLYRYKRIR